MTKHNAEALYLLPLNEQEQNIAKLAAEKKAAELNALNVAHKARLKAKSDRRQAARERLNRMIRTKVMGLPANDNAVRFGAIGGGWTRTDGKVEVAA